MTKIQSWISEEVTYLKQRKMSWNEPEWTKINRKSGFHSVRSFAIAISRAYFEAQKHRKYIRKKHCSKQVCFWVPTKRDSNQYPLLQWLARKLKFPSEQVYRYTFQLAKYNDADQSVRIRFSQTPKTGFPAPRPISCLLYSLKQCYVTSHFGSSRRISTFYVFIYM